LEPGYACVFPWLGSTAFRTLERFLRVYGKPALNIKGVKGRAPYFLVVSLGKCPLENLYHELKSLANRHLRLEELLAPDEVPQSQKYDQFILPQLLRQAFATDDLNWSELAQAAQKW
jgi:ATP-dependent Lhr-like helicase